MNVKETHMIEGTPFVSLKTEEEKCMIALGNQIISELEFESHEEVKSYVSEKPWDLLINTMLIMSDHIYSVKKMTDSDEETKRLEEQAKDDIDVISELFDE